MDQIDQNYCTNKNDLMLTIKTKTERDNSKIGILDTEENTFKNSSATRTQNSNRTSIALPRKRLDTENLYL